MRTLLKGVTALKLWSFNHHSTDNYFEKYECFAYAPVPIEGGRKIKMIDGTCIPQTRFACNVCRVLLCKSCFWNVYDHRKRGVPVDCVTLR